LLDSYGETATARILPFDAVELVIERLFLPRTTAPNEPPR